MKALFEKIITCEQGNLEDIAWNNTWEGGEGVFTARHLLEEEVFDVDRNLRMSRPIKYGLPPVSISIYPNPVVNHATIYYNNLDDPKRLKLIITDFTGKPVLETNTFQNGVDVSQLSTGIYSFSFYIDGIYNSSAKIEILK